MPLSLVVCGGEEMVQAEATVAVTTVPTEPPELWGENLLRQVNPWNVPGFDFSVLGNRNVERKQVTAIAFLYTLADAPETAWDASENEDGSVLAWVDVSGGQHCKLKFQLLR